MARMIPIEDRKYVLRYPLGISASGKRRWQYWADKTVSRKLNDATIFTLQQARNQRQYGHSTRGCEIKRITDKMLFVAALEGR